MLLFGGVEDGRHAENVVELAAIFFGYVDRVDEGREGSVGFVRAKDEYFGGCDRVEPAFYPGPDGGEEGGSADYLGSRV